jgi:hypothetical protein
MSDTFDTTFALSAMFLWIIFSYLANMLNCDLQRLLKSSLLVVHISGILAFFFLFTLLDPNNKSSIGAIWLKTLFVYILFVAMTKSKVFFVVPVLILLLIDQSLKKEVAIREAKGLPDEVFKGRQEYISKIINITIIVIIAIGSLHYLYLQSIQHRNKFSFKQFFFGIADKCQKVH